MTLKTQVLFINIMAAQGHKRVCVIMKKSENTQHITQLCDICLIATAAKKVLKKTRRKNLFLQTITGYVLPINTLLLQENYCCSLILQGGLMVQDLPLTWWAWLSFPSIPPQTHTHAHTWPPLGNTCSHWETCTAQHSYTLPNYTFIKTL